MKVLSLCPGASQIGYAYFEGEKLIDRGIRNNKYGAIPERLFTKGLRIILGLVSQFEPETVILPLIESRRRVTSRRFARAAEAILATTPCQVVFSPLRKCLEFFRMDIESARPTKHRISNTLAKIFPELEPMVPRPRRPWDPQDYWTPMFDALAQGYAWIKTHHEK
jgi:hypothetical protein